MVVSGVCGYEDACGERERLECPYSVCDGCPLNPKEEHNTNAQPERLRGEGVVE